MSITSARAALERAVEGLTFESESDEPLEVFVWPRADIGDEISDAWIKDRHGAGSGDPVERLAFEDFFRPLVEHKKWHRKQESDVVRGYQKLFETIRTHLQEVRVYKTGSIEKSVYIVGKTKTGDWAGIKTTAIET